jgi:hypothetical protein
MTEVGGPPQEPAAATPIAKRPHPVRNAVVQLVTITAGVLIALFFDGLVSWNQNRALVREAKATIAREIADNKKELEGALSGAPTRSAGHANAIKLATDLLRQGKSDVREINIGFTMAELGSASWATAERTGALGYMDYADVQRYSKIYAWQDLFVAQQRRALDRLASATAVLGNDDPYKADPRDLELFRQHLLGLRGELEMAQQLGTRLTELYAAELKR